MNQEPNDYQIAGDHYQTEDKYQLWDLFVDINLNFLLANAVKYIYRCKRKNGINDLEKAIHYIDKFFSLDIDKQINLLEQQDVTTFDLPIAFMEKETNLSQLQKRLITYLCSINQFKSIKDAENFIKRYLPDLQLELQNATHN
jgi:hypothetical protein